MQQRSWALKRKRRCGENFNTVGGMDDGSSDDGGMGGSSSFSASASGLPNGNHQRHHLRQEERGLDRPLGKKRLPYIRMLTAVNENFGLRWRG
jgi:hypothetical protein